MIKVIDGLMVHWGEQLNRHGLGAGIGSQMGSIMQWKGAAPRGTPGSRIIRGGLGMDLAASEIDAAVAALERGDEMAKKLAKLARQRYCQGATVREQMQAAGIAEGAERTYRNWVHKLHQRVLLFLTQRSSINAGLVCRVDADQQVTVARPVALGQ